MPTGPRIPPAPTREQSQRAALRDRVSQVEALAEENRTLKSQLEALQHSNKVAALWANIETIALARAVEAGLDQAGVGEVVASVGAAWNKHVEAGTKLESFDVYSPLATRIAELKGSIAPGGRNASPLTPLEALPPPAPDARPALNDVAAREQAHRAAQERGRELAEQVLRDRAAYREALKRHGLEDPSVGGRSNASGRNFGL